MAPRGPLSPPARQRTDGHYPTAPYTKSLSRYCPQLSFSNSAARGAALLWPVQVDASATPEEKPQPVLSRTARTEGAIIDTRHPPQLDRSTPSTTLPESDSEPIDQRGFIRTFAKRQGVSTSALESIWRSNKHGYKVAYDAPFARFQQLFREVKPDCSFSPEHILPGDLVSFLEREHANGATFDFHGL